MIELSVFSRATRALRGNPRFVFASQATGVAADYLKCANDEARFGKLVGVYLNPAGEQPEAVAVAEKGLFVFRSDAQTWIQFSEVESLTTPPKQQNSSLISLNLATGNVAHIKIAGSDGKFRDVFAFIRFLMRVLQDFAARAD